MMFIPTMTTSYAVRAESAMLDSSSARHRTSATDLLLLCVGVVVLLTFLAFFAVFVIKTLRRRRQSQSMDEQRSACNEEPSSADPSYDKLDFTSAAPIGQQDVEFEAGISWIDACGFAKNQHFMASMSTISLSISTEVGEGNLVDELDSYSTPSTPGSSTSDRSEFPSPVSSPVIGHTFDKDEEEDIAGAACPYFGPIVVTPLLDDDEEDESPLSSPEAQAIIQKHFVQQALRQWHRANRGW